MNNLALVYFQQGKYAQAETLNNQTLEIRRRVRGPEHPDTLSTLSDFASMYQRQGKYALAENPAAQALTGKRHTLGPEHPDTIDSASALALSYQSQGKFAESELLAREVVEFDRKRPGKADEASGGGCRLSTYEYIGTAARPIFTHASDWTRSDDRCVYRRSFPPGAHRSGVTDRRVAD